MTPRPTSAERTEQPRLARFVEHPDWVLAAEAHHQRWGNSLRLMRDPDHPEWWVRPPFRSETRSPMVSVEGVNLAERHFGALGLCGIAIPRRQYYEDADGKVYQATAHVEGVRIAEQDRPFPPGLSDEIVVAACGVVRGLREYRALAGANFGDFYHPSGTTFLWDIYKPEQFMYGRQVGDPEDAKPQLYLVDTETELGGDVQRHLWNIGGRQLTSWERSIRTHYPQLAQEHLDPPVQLREVPRSPWQHVVDWALRQPAEMEPLPPIPALDIRLADDRLNF